MDDSPKSSARMAQERADERAAESMTRTAAGMGFWRLVFVIAAGIVIAEIVMWLGLAILRALSRPGILNI